MIDPWVLQRIEAAEKTAREAIRGSEELDMLVLQTLGHRPRFCRDLPRFPPSAANVDPANPPEIRPVNMGPPRLIDEQQITRVFERAIHAVPRPFQFEDLSAHNGVTGPDAVYTCIVSNYQQPHRELSSGRTPALAVCAVSIKLIGLRYVESRGEWRPA